jgi:DNA polymerase-3 subunit beta
MEIRIPVAELARTLPLVQGVAASNTRLTILSHVLLDARDEALHLTVTDRDVTIQFRLPCEVIEPGAMTIPAKPLSDIMRSLPGPDVTLKRLPNEHVEVKCGRTKARLHGLWAEDYPKLPKTTVELADVDGKALLDAIDGTLFAACQDESRGNLMGVRVEPRETGGVTLAATDGHRLVRLESPLLVVPGAGGQKTLPRKGLTEARRLLAGKPEQVRLGISDKHAVLQVDGVTLTMSVVEGAFPDINAVIPKRSPVSVRVERSDLLCSLKRLGTLADDKLQPVRLSKSADDVLRLTCINPERGEIVDDVPAVIEGTMQEMALNARYLADAAHAIGVPGIDMLLTDALSPVIVRGRDEPGHIVVVMPMRM